MLARILLFRFNKVLCAPIFFCTLFCAAAEEPKPSGWSVAPLLPADTMAVITAPDAQKMIAKLKQTGLWQIVANPDVQNAFRSPLTQARFGLQVAELQLGLKLNDILSYISQGEVTFAVLALDRLNEEGRPVPDMLISVQARDKAGALMEELNKRVDQLNAQVGGVLQITQTPQGDANIKRVSVPGRPETFTYAVCDGTVLAALGDGRVEKVLALREKARAGAKAAANESLGQVASFKKTLEKAGPNTDLMLYVNVETLRKNDILDLKPKNGADRMAWEVLGIDSIRSVSYSLGVKDKGIREVTYVDVPAAARKGLLALLDGDGLESDLLASAPRNSIAAMAVKVTPEKIYDKLVELAAVENPNAKEEIDTALIAAGQQLNLDLKREVFNALTGQAVFSVSLVSRHPKLPIGFPHPLLTLGIKDPVALKNLLKSVREAGREKFDYTEVADGENTIQVAREKFPEGQNPGQIAYTIDKNDLIVSLYPMALREELRRRAAGAKAEGVYAPGGNLADDKDFKTARANVGGAPRAMLYVDTGALAVGAYDLLIPVAQLAPRAPQLDVSALPTSDVLLQNLGGAVFGLNADADGILAEGFSSTGGVSFLLVAIPAVIKARREAMQRNMEGAAGEQNKSLEQVGAALELYARDNAGKYPAALKEANINVDPDKVVYRGRQDAANKIVAHSSEKQRGPISALLQDGRVVRVGRAQLGKALKDGYTEQAAPTGRREEAVKPPKPPDGNF